MGLRESFQKMIDKKQQEIRALEGQLREAEVYVQALQDSMKLLPRDSSGEPAEHTLRPGSALAKAREVLKAAGTAMPIGDILKSLGKPQDKKHRVSLAGTLSGYARKGKVFTKTAPNTFGLVEFGAAANTPDGDDLPDEFGRMQ
jgi:hypothetical protein